MTYLHHSHKTTLRPWPAYVIGVAGLALYFVVRRYDVTLRRDIARLGL